MFAVPRGQAGKAELRMMSTVEDARHTITFMTEYCIEHNDNDLQQLTIADAFACLGGNTHSFCRTFKDVVAYEIDDTRRENLTINMRRYGRKCRVFGDCEAEENGIFTTPRDIIFLDPKEKESITGRILSNYRQTCPRTGMKFQFTESTV